MSTFNTSRDRLLSLWQSAAAKVAQRHRPALATEAALATGGEDPIAAQANRFVERVSNRVKHNGRAALSPQDVRGAPAPGIATEGVVDGAAFCAETAFELALARLRGQRQRARDLETAFKDGTCDPRWGECILEFLAHAGIEGQKSIPYRSWSSLSDFVIDGVLKDVCKVAIVGDWGTGQDRARSLLQRVAAQKPDVFIHLGDIYYSGTSDEMADNFLRICRKVLPKSVPIFTLCGNHDVYAGGQPYYALLDAIGQPASFFALRNNHWQLLGMDTGYNDYDPLDISENVTSLQASEVQWHKDKIINNAGRGTVLMSHHQLFSATGIADKPLNPRLAAQFSDVIANVDLWAWGHEHSHIAFDAYAGLRRGRCIGAGGIPIATDDPNQDPYANKFPQNGPAILPPRIGVDPTGVLYNLGYAVLSLNGPNAMLQHFNNQSDTPFYTETIR